LELAYYWLILVWWKKDMRGILTFTMVALSLTFWADGLLSAVYADPGKGLSAAARATSKKSDPPVYKKDLAAAYRVHTYRRSCIASQLDELWAQEREISQEREQFGRAGDMASVRRVERDLLAVRKEIDSLRAELTKENRVIALIDHQMSTKQ
jgi:hypothetical protein